MPTIQKIAAFKNELRNAFNAITFNSNSELYPINLGNRDPLVMEYCVACELVKIAEARKETAHKALIDNDILFDHKKTPRAPGEYNIYASNLVTINLIVKNGTFSIDTKKFKSELVKQGVDNGKILIAEAAATTQNAGAHTFSVAINEGG